MHRKLYGYYVPVQQQLSPHPQLLLAQPQSQPHPPPFPQQQKIRMIRMMIHRQPQLLLPNITSTSFQLACFAICSAPPSETFYDRCLSPVPGM
jgi:hypothetical protein